MNILRNNVLYSFRRCPYAMRARMAIAASGIQVELREVVLRDKPQALLDISAKATVPVLLTSDNTVIDESLDIMHWLDRYKYADRYPERSEHYYRQHGEETLLMLEKLLEKSAYLAGDSITFTDIAIFPFIRQFASVNLKWFEIAPYPKLRAWLNTFINSVLFEKTMVKYKPWKESGIVTVFPEEV